MHDVADQDSPKGYLKDKPTAWLKEQYRYADKRYRQFGTRYYGQRAELIAHLLMKRGEPIIAK